MEGLNDPTFPGINVKALRIVGIDEQGKHEDGRQTNLFCSGQLAITAIANIQAYLGGNAQLFASQTIDEWIRLLYFDFTGKE